MVEPRVVNRGEQVFFFFFFFFFEGTLTIVGLLENKGQLLPMYPLTSAIMKRLGVTFRDVGSSY